MLGHGDHRGQVGTVTGKGGHRAEAERPGPDDNRGRLPVDMHPDPQDYRGRVTQSVYRVYERLLRAANAVDFGDLLLLLVVLFRTHPDVLERYQRRFRYVLVDEFQDTNPVQYQMLRLLAPAGSNLAVVGDDDQSIYRWRGASVHNILGFQEDYGDTKLVKLEQNYRSDQAILEAAYAVISKNEERVEKKLWSQRPRGELLNLIVARRGSTHTQRDRSASSCA